MDLLALSHTLKLIADTLWGWPLIGLLVVTGLWLTVYLHGLTLWRLPRALWDVLGPQRHDALAHGMISNRSAMLTALAATVGTGNIAGVATAIAIGGPGAMFWMWVSGLLGMALKFSETLLGVHYRVRERDGTYRGGPMHYLTHGANMPWLGMLFAIALTFAAISIGGMVQSNSIADAMASGFGISPSLTGALVVAMAAAILFGGLKRIARAADVLVPFMIALFAGSGLLILALNAAYVPALFATIFRDAFQGTAAAGGFAGATLMMAMRYGLARGVFANESGLGSAPIVAATAKTRHPAEQAFISMTQTFIDTFFVCTFTGLVILITGAWQAEGLASAGASLTAFAFNSGLGNLALASMPVGSMIVAICLLLFAFTTILGWGYYGQQGAVYVLGQRAATPYLVVFLVATFAGAGVLDWAASIRDGVTLIWTLADITVACMLVPNLLGLLILSPKVKALSMDYLRHLKTGERLAHAPFYFEAAAAPRHSSTAPVVAAKMAPKASTPPRRATARPTKRR